MDPTWLLGVIMGAALIVNGIGMDKLGNFIDVDSIVIVLGGTVAALIASYPFSILKEVPKHLILIIRGGRKYSIPKLIDQLVDLAMVARQSGLLALEEKAEEIKNPFLKQSVLMIVDASDPDKVQAALEKEMETMVVRHDQAAGVYEKGSAYAPAFGMIGTLVGLINMLKGMNLSDSDGASSMGEDMGVALITTFYGSTLANLVFQPIAKKLRILEDDEELYCSIIIEGVLAIMAGENPKTLRERLLSSLKQSTKKKLLAKAEKAGPATDEGGGEG